MNTRVRLLSALAVALGFELVVACAQAPRMDLCPTTINVEQRMTNSPAGWDVIFEEARLDLASVTVFDGPPAQQASLVNDAQQEQGSEFIATWKFDAAQAKRGIWLACSYSRTTAVLSRRLPASTTSCTVAYDKQVTVPGGGMGVKDIQCR